MKKTLLATAIAGALGASAAAQAATTVYDQDGTKLDVYGRLALAVTTGGVQEDGDVKSDGSEFTDLGSRFGFIAEEQVSQDFSVFGRMEFRADMDEKSDTEFQVRNTYAGVKSQTYGQLWAGNFDAITYQAGSVLFDVPENAGWESITSVDNQSHGDSIAYKSPEFAGFTTWLQGKHHTGNGSNDPAREGAAETERESSTISAQAAVSYEQGPFYGAITWDQDKHSFSGSDNTPDYVGNDEDIFGAYASYQVLPALSLRAGYETQDENEELGARGTDIAMVGFTADYMDNAQIYGQYAHVDEELGDEDETLNRWMLGTNYFFSDQMYAFAEVYQQDQESLTDDTVEEEFRSFDDDILTTVGVRYDF
ncbi:porin [Aidingimonas halophila]|uniref:Outer membrane protein (Porin) n=1 Tax=Aidingimonas halophila TaxID=574349 RepID=A0A1H2RSI9_9GAMM|nr:porin [Aidingimonas halophila]GHC18778.1 porin [Aidingimonas halophila]SDW22277.1 Outer membrane protein (porin) [Aidingimonas halophila]